MSTELTANRIFLTFSLSIFSKEYLDAHSDWPIYSAPMLALFLIYRKEPLVLVVYENLQSVVP